MTKNRIVSSIVGLLFVVAFILANFSLSVSAQAHKNPWDDASPAKTQTDLKPISDPNTLAYIRTHKPAPLTPADVKHMKAGTSVMRTFTSYSAWAGVAFTTTGGGDKGMMATTSVAGGLTLTKPNSSVDVGTVYGEMQPYKSCLFNYFWTYSPPGTTATTHVFVVDNTCTGGFLSWTVDSTTWTKYINQINIPSITDPGVNNTDKISYVRNYQWSPSINGWRVDVWNMNTQAWDVFGSTTGTNNANGGSYLDFLHYGDTTVNGSYCVSLGAWNILHGQDTFKYNGTSFVGLFGPDVDTYYLDSGDPCMNTGTGNSSWYFAHTGTSGLDIPRWSLCGPSNNNCRP